MHPLHEQPGQPKEPHHHQQTRNQPQQRTYSKQVIMNVLSVMLDNQDVPQPNTKPLNQAILDADTEAYYSSDEDLHPFHEAPRTTPAARGAKKLSPQKIKNQIMKQDILDALNETTSDEDTEDKAPPPRPAPTGELGKLKKQNSVLQRKVRKLQKTMTNTTKTLSNRRHRTLAAVQSIRKIYYANQAELNQARQHMDYMHSVLINNTGTTSPKTKTRTPDEIIDLYNPFASTNP